MRSNKNGDKNENNSREKMTRTATIRMQRVQRQEKQDHFIMKKQQERELW